MSVRKLGQTKSSRVPFPDLPLPYKYKKITKKIVKSAPTPAVAPVRKHPEHQAPIDTLEVQEPIIGGDLMPEPSKLHDQGDHVVEEIDYSDY